MLSMADITTFDIMAAATVRTGKDTLHERIVKGVSVIELPVENFVRPYELVLSTGMGCGHNPELLESFVKDILISNPSALALATGRYISSIPDNIIRLAEAYHFPLIELPWKLHFADITQTIVEAINDSREKALKQSEKIQQQLLNLILNGGHPAEITQYIFENTGNPAMIVNREGIIKGTSRNANALVEQWSSHTGTGQEKSIKTETPSLNKFPIRSVGSIQGHIIVAESNDPLPKNRNILEHAATAAGLWFLRENAIEETESRLHGDFVWNLAKGNLNESWQQIHTRARSLQIDIDASYVCLFGKLENKTNKGPQQTLTQDILQQITSLQIAMNRKIIVSCREHKFLVFLEASFSEVTDTVESFFKQLKSRLIQFRPQPVLSWGIGEPYTGVRTFQEGFGAAYSAMHIGRQQKGPGQQTAYHDIRIYQALNRLSKNDDIQTLTQEVIGNLIRYKGDKDIDLMHTFNAYLQGKENISRTARSLHLHRQSLVYRLQKIETLTHHSLDDPDDVFLIHLCIKLWMAGMANDIDE